MNEPTRQRDRLHGLAVVGIAFLTSLGISFWAKRVSEPEQGKPPAPPTTTGIVGWPNAVDPIKTLSVARSLTRRVLLRGMVIEGARSDAAGDVGEFQRGEASRLTDDIDQQGIESGPERDVGNRLRDVGRGIADHP